MKKIIIVICYLFSMASIIYSQSVINLYVPEYNKMIDLGQRKLSLSIDKEGRITKIQKENEESYSSISYVAGINYKSINPSKKTESVRDIGNCDFKFTEDTITFDRTVNGAKNEYTYKNGILISAKNNEPYNYYIYLDSGDYVECIYNFVTFGDVDSYDLRYKFQKKDLDTLRNKNIDINKLNASVLACSGFEVLIPFLFTNYVYNVYPESYTASSELKEKNAFYTAENLREKAGLPWASANGYGINDKIQITTPTYNGLQLAFYNGFQSENRPDLYKANSRAKKIRIKNLETGSSKDFTLKDSMEMQIISLLDLNIWSNVNTNLEITILEVYPGEKYKDLCIQAIIPEY